MSKIPSIGSKVMNKNVSLIPNLSGCPRYFLANISRSMADKEKLFMGIIIRTRKYMLFEDEQNLSSGFGDMTGKVVKLRSLRGFQENLEKYDRYRKMMMTFSTSSEL